MSNTWHSVGRYTLPVGLFILWEALYLLVKEPAMASPWQSIVALVNNAGEWLTDIGITLTALLVSFAICAVMGTIFGFFVGLSSFWTQTIHPILLALYSIPKVTLYPVFLLVFGLTVEGRIAFSVFHGIFPICIICMEATRMIPKTYLKLATAYQMSFVQKVRYIIIPAILPQLVVGLRMGFSLCFLGLILSEMFASYKGLGYRLTHYMALNQTSAILALFLIVIFLAFFFTFIFLLWQERMERKIGKTERMIEADSRGQDRS
ncbi:ABC transporter permease [Effusibacillus dendaii]|uniref:ABC transporter permease n=1 Tax=Effusibacillus dendaii TaxID=2743772 RepID=UPI00190989D4|nr:ABC transporter permease subunit [Effusibacillus dendaii]